MTSVAQTPASSLTALLSGAPTTQVGPQANNTQMNQFLTMLTTELKNQDPTQPTDPTQFVAQLAQFSTVEQLTQSNSSLTTINQTLSSLAVGQYAGMINHTVSASASAITLPLSGGSSQMSYQVTDASLSKPHVVITNASGTVVRTLALGSSSGTVTFDGTDGTGAALPAGQYGISLVGTTAAGAVQSAGTLNISGTVTGVAQDSTGAWQLQLQDGRSVAATSVTALN